MNCLNFVFVPKAIESKEKLDYLYNRHVKRFYSDHLAPNLRPAHLAAPMEHVPSPAAFAVFPCSQTKL